MTHVEIPDNDSSNCGGYYWRRKLIFQVRKHRILYDRYYKDFGNMQKQDEAWFKIANYLKSDVNVCKKEWIEMRYNYQRYVRRLRKFFAGGYKPNYRRPIMNFETELLFLYRFIDDRVTCILPFNFDKSDKEKITVEAIHTKNTDNNDVDDDLILIEQPIELIVIDEDEEENKADFVITEDIKQLIEYVKSNQELYDAGNSLYNDYKCKGLIWNSIANKMSERATKLIKLWIVIQTRYEWEICQEIDSKGKPSELQKLLGFLEPHILKNGKTIYKQSYFLKKSWEIPLERFHDSYSLLKGLRKLTHIIAVTEREIASSNKTQEYLALWKKVPKLMNNEVTPGQCEVLWLIMRSFYCELLKMRRCSYPLSDRWYFECYISNLFKSAHVTLLNEIIRCDAKLSISTKKNDNHNSNKRHLQEKISPNAKKIKLSIDNVKPPFSLLPTSMTKLTNPIKIVNAPIVENSVVADNSIKSHNILTTVGIKTNQQPNSVILAKPTIQGNLISAPVVPPGSPRVPASVRVRKLLATKPQSTFSLVSTSLANSIQSTVSATNITQVNSVEEVIPQKNISPVQLQNNTKQNANIPAPHLNAKTVNKQVKQRTVASATTYTLPKISGVTTLLNPNEILIELIATVNGNILVVRGPPLAEEYSLSTNQIIAFVREVMAIPQIHTNRYKQPALINSYWAHIAGKFNLPTHICRACWNFFIHNFNQLPNLAPMTELMKPFHTNLNVWRNCDTLFIDFHQRAVTNGWLKLRRLPEVMEYIGTYTVLYKDVNKEDKEKNSETNMEFCCAWRTVRLRFQEITNIMEIWEAFKNVFLEYMDHLEIGIVNRWPSNWWQTLARMKFLQEVRYSSMEPMYYIVRNKINEEIERCALNEMKNKYGGIKNTVENEARKTIDMTIATDAQRTTATTVSNTQLVSSKVTVNSDLQPELEIGALLTSILKRPAIYNKLVHPIDKYEAWKKVAKEFNIEVTDCLLLFHKALEKYRNYKLHDTDNTCHLNQEYYSKFDELVKLSKSIKINIRTFSESYQSTANEKLNSNPKDIIPPESFVSEINMTKCSPTLVVKNWMYAMKHIHNEATSQQLCMKLKAILSKYLGDV